MHTKTRRLLRAGAVAMLKSGIFQYGRYKPYLCPCKIVDGGGNYLIIRHTCVVQDICRLPYHAAKLLHFFQQRKYLAVLFVCAESSGKCNKVTQFF